MTLTTKRREREKQARRACILDAAESVFFSRGIDVATMDEIAQAAELSKGALYLYFKSKEALCAAIGERKIGEFIAQVKPAVAAASTGLAAVDSFLRTYRAFALRHPNHIKLAVSWMISGWKSDLQSSSFLAYRNRIGEVIGVMVQAIETGKRDGSIRRSLDSYHLAAQLWTGSLGTLLPGLNPEEAAARTPVPIEFDRLFALYVDNMMRAIATEAP